VADTVCELMNRSTAVLHELWCGAPAAQDAASGHPSTGRAGSGKCSGQCMPSWRGGSRSSRYRLQRQLMLSPAIVPELAARQCMLVSK